MKDRQGHVYEIVRTCAVAALGTDDQETLKRLMQGDLTEPEADQLRAQLALVCAGVLVEMERWFNVLSEGYGPRLHGGPQPWQRSASDGPDGEVAEYDTKHLAQQRLAEALEAATMELRNGGHALRKAYLAAEAYRAAKAL